MSGGVKLPYPTVDVRTVHSSVTGSIRNFEKKSLQLQEKNITENLPVEIIYVFYNLNNIKSLDTCACNESMMLQPTLSMKT